MRDDPPVARMKERFVPDLTLTLELLAFLIVIGGFLAVRPLVARTYRDLFLGGDLGKAKGKGVGIFV